MVSIHRALQLLPGLFLAGCVAVGPDYTAPDVKVPVAWSNDAGSAATVTQAATDLGDWWNRLDDSLLADLVREAMTSAPDLRTAQARLRQARAGATGARAGLFPEIGASATANRGRSSRQAGTGSTRELYDAGFDASWELDVFGGKRRGVEAAQADLDAASLSLEDVRISLAAEVVTNYIDVRALQIRTAIARNNLASQAETLQLTEWRSQAGLVSIQDVEQARSASDQTRAQIPLLQAALAEAEHRLEVLLGRAPGSLHASLDTPPRLPGIPDTLAVGIPADTLRQRPDVRAAERSLAAETARVGVAEAARYPSFNISGSIGLEALTAGALDEPGATTSSLFAGITAPIFDAGRRRSQVEAQDAIREQAQVAYEQAVLRALQDVEDSLVGLARNGERGAALTRAADSARVAARLARLRYSAGLIDFQSVLDTERSVLNLEDNLASTQADQVLSLIRLYKSLGGGWTPIEPAGAGKVQ